MRLLITGGCGFIGSNYVQQVLNETDDVVVNLDKLTYAGNRLNLAQVEERHGGRRYHFVHGDIGDAELVQRVFDEKRIEAVVNFAAETHVDRSIHDSAPFLNTNIMGAHNLLECARKAGIERFVHVSTDEVYGSLEPNDPAFSEETPLAPNSPYSASKASADLLCRAYFHTYGYPVVVTRCSNNYGPYQFPEKLIPLMYLKASRDEPLPVYGDGRNVRDWIYVGDHCRGVDLALRKGRPGAVYNFGGAAERANIDVVKAMLNILGKGEDLIRYVKDRPGHDKRYAMDFSLAARELGFAPSLDFEEGLARTVRWYENNAQWLTQVQDGSYREFMANWYGERA
ncbi:dTDP-glucose 4,6-dehydratase [Desulfocurvibacter africanus]|uniref:dTDP-glucose 4,6-dehydratase n=1 Tax=Desulfocurvibacter africanus subsp. africanus str. Walvis Bay TaxID=690850 RepID=F3Z409_DESAF|nr:dTDP-glucose 4,6-dehydratase [Desulfocurvibacter africanus]EGJ50461.1 dTDP-glucose 4,6-dehydratase [Desulfocurvibacter africanus subsp. africanus str. Walvis Bay]